MEKLRRLPGHSYRRAHRRKGPSLRRAHSTIDHRSTSHAWSLWDNELCQLRQFAAKQYNSPSPPVLLRSACEQPPSRPARLMGRVPGFRGVIVAQPEAVEMPHRRGTLRAARPVLAGAVVADGKRGTAPRNQPRRLLSLIALRGSGLLDRREFPIASARPQ